LNWLDIVIIVILVISAWGGMRRGLIEMVLGLAGVVVGIILAGKYSTQVGDWLNISSPDMAHIVAFIIILLVTILVFYLIAKILNKIASITLLGWFNRLCGAILGVLIAALIMAALLAVIVKLTNWSVAGDSLIAPFFLEHFPKVLSLLPSYFDGVKDWFSS